MNLLLLVLKIPLDLSLDASHENNGFSKALLKKDLKFIPIRRDGTIAFNLDLMLLPAGVDPISKEQGCKR